MTIKVFVPQKEDGIWLVSARVKRGGPMRRCKTATSAFRIVEGKVNRFKGGMGKEKLVLEVIYGKGYHNETVAYPFPWTDEQKKEMLYVFTCFMEDYLNEQLLERRYRRYNP